MDENKDIRVIVLLDDPDVNNNADFRETASVQFLKGYADSDSVYE